MKENMFLRGMSKEDVVAHCKYKPTRDAFIETISLDCKDDEICKLFDLMLDNIGVFAQVEVSDFLKNSVLNVTDSFALAGFVKDKRISPYNKRGISERVVELKIPQSNFECAKYYDGEEFSANLADFGVNNQHSIKEWREKLVHDHCGVILRCKEPTLNKQCAAEIEHCNKKAHASVYEQSQGMNM